MMDYRGMSTFLRKRKTEYSDSSFLYCFFFWPNDHVALNVHVRTASFSVVLLWHFPQHKLCSWSTITIIRRHHEQDFATHFSCEGEKVFLWSQKYGDYQGSRRVKYYYFNNSNYSLLIRTRWSDYVAQLAWECLGILPEELEEVSGEREVWVSLLRQLPLRPGPG